VTQKKSDGEATRKTAAESHPGELFGLGPDLEPALRPGQPVAYGSAALDIGILENRLHCRLDWASSSRTIEPSSSKSSTANILSSGVRTITLATGLSPGG